jgi:hypothetical protein
MVEKYRFSKVKFSDFPYEGRQRVTFNTLLYSETENIPAGTLLVKTNQRTLRVIVNLLEPHSPDSFVHWGFFNSFFERKEYAEEYIMEPIAKEMLDKDDNLKAEFYKKLNTDKEFKEDPLRRIDFFYKRSPYFDMNEKVYPIRRVPKVD